MVSFPLQCGAWTAESGEAVRIDGNQRGGILRHLGQLTGDVERTYARLSSGLKIAQAADDASGLAMSERLRSLIESYGAVERGVTDGVSLARTGEQALGEVNDILGRMRELAVQSANGTLNDADRAALQEEYGALRDEVDRLASSTEYNGEALLDGTSGDVSIQAGPEAGDTIDIELGSVTSADLALDSGDISTSAGASDVLADIDAAIESVSTLRGSFGSTTNALESRLSSLGETRENLAEAESRIRDADFALETALLVQQRIRQSGAVGLQAQANLSNSLAADLLR